MSYNADKTNQVQLWSNIPISACRERLKHAFLAHFQLPRAVS